jgi:hypothetical protein
MKSDRKPQDKKQALRLTLFAGIAFVALMAGCATVGHDFPAVHVSDIHINKTTQQEVRDMFGPPWRVGNEDGQRTWTYGKYVYRVFGEGSTQDLVIRFNDKNVVASFTFNTTEHAEKSVPPGR